MSMKLTFLGTGNAARVPAYGCDCAACERARHDSKHARQHSSVLVETDTTTVLVDAGIEVCSKFAPGDVDAILITHFHVDHVQGLFDLRWGKGFEQRVLTPPDEEGCADLYRNHGILHFETLSAFEAIDVGDMRVTPLPLAHSKLTFGYVIENRGKSFAYLTDTIGLPPDTKAFLERSVPDVIAIDCTYPPVEGGAKKHNDVVLACEILQELAPQRGLLTHIGHDLDAWLSGNSLPQGVEAAADGLVIDLG